ncbi:indeterminate-domain 1 protein [Nymphaea thermarum]|nr:indeterminate-domain 1 protein [Nymphaea thermarum]
MAAGPSPKISFGIIEEENCGGSSYGQVKQQASSTTATTNTPQKKKRNPDAEVIALSPKTLMATNRFICEVCNKGFQREQNLQLHRRGHNLPWKLKQKSTKEVKKKVYVCPETTCVHHDPSRALGDLTGIKKHFCRKHGEKKWKCEKCSKKYAVQSDWKAHSKTCGTREYRCDCGTLFSRRDSFITHRAFCDALAQESARLPSGLQLYSHQSSDMLRLQGGGPQLDMIPSSTSALRSLPSFFPSALNQNFHEVSQALSEYTGLTQIASLSGNGSTTNNPAGGLFNLGFLSNGSLANSRNDGSNSAHLAPSGLSSIPDHFGGNIANDHMSETVSSLYTSHIQNGGTVLPQMSATALLHKAAQIGAGATGNSESLLGGFGSSATNTVGLNWQDQRSSSSSSSFPASNSSSFHMTNLDQMRPNFSNCQESHLQDIMNSLENSNMRAAFGGNLRIRGRDNGGDGGGHFISANNCMNLENQRVLDSLEDKFHHNSASALSLGGSDGLTRDFLGVGGMNRGFIEGAFGRRDQHHERNVNFAPMDLEMKSYNEGYLH